MILSLRQGYSRCQTSQLEVYSSECDQLSQLLGDELLEMVDVKLVLRSN